MHSPKLILVGIISSAYGIKGLLVVKSYTKPISNIGNLILLNHNRIALPISKVRMHLNKFIIYQHNRCSNRNQAEKIVGTKLYCTNDSLPIPGREEFYFENLKNLEVLDSNRIRIGIVRKIFNFGAGDLIEVEFLNGLKNQIYPFTKEFFPCVTKKYLIIVQDNSFN